MINFELSDQQKSIRELAREFSRKIIVPVAAKHDQSMEFPLDVVQKAHAQGLLNTSIPEKLGGIGLTCLEQSIVWEELAGGCTGISTAIGANDLALAPVLLAGNDAQFEEFVKPMIDTPTIAAYAVTEPGAGSDVAGVRTTVKPNGDHYLLNGAKMWITGAGQAKWFFVLATLDPKAGPKGMCGFVIPADLDGIQVGKKEVNLGQRCSDTRGITFENVKVAKKYLLGKEGDGFKIAMGAFDHTRPLVGASATGLSQAAFDHATKYALERHAFGKPIAQHQAVAFMIADMARDIEAARLLVWKAASEIDAGRRNTKFASFAKCFAGDMAVRVTSDAIQVFGGYGYNSEYPVEKLYRDAKIFQIYEGTQQIQRLIISRHVFDEKLAQ